MKDVKMKLVKVAVLVFLLAGLADCERESFEWSNLTWSFEVDQSHIIDGQDVRTYYGAVFPWVENGGQEYDFRESIGEVDSLSGMFHLMKSSRYEDYYFATYDKDVGNSRPGFKSNMNLTEFIDFLESVKIEPA
jgi:hypothetical protein